MAILEGILTGSLANQLIVNRFHYIGAGDTGPVTPSFCLLAALGFIAPTPPATAFETGSFALSLQDNVCDDYIFKAFYVRNLYDVTDFVEQAYPATVTGTKTTEVESPVMALGLTGSRVRTDIKRASKRFAGIPDNLTDNLGILNSTGLAVGNAWADKLSDVLTYSVGGASYTLTPAVLGLQAYTTPSGKTAYRPFSTESAQLDHVATGFTFTPMSTLRSQTSRQVGRGA